MFKPFLSAAAFGAASLVASPSAAIPVDLELLFLNDVSGSIDSTDFAFQTDGFASAFRSSSLIDRIVDGEIGSIAVSVAFFATDLIQSLPFTQIGSAADGEAFATAIEGLSRPSAGAEDGQVNALTLAPDLFADNGFEGTRNVIDVVTEGTESLVSSCASVPVCPEVQAARDAALAGGIDAINALVLDDRSFFGNDPGDAVNAVDYAETNLVGGLGSFSVFVEDFTGFAAGIEAKIAREVTPPMPVVPLPAGLPLLLGALGALGVLRRRKT